jgi:hypothetical protein
MKKFSYLLRVNECIEMFGGINEVYDWFKERGVKELLLEEGDNKMSIIEGVNFLREVDFLGNSGVKCYNKELIEGGDDWCDIRLWEGFVNC